ncbi:hypothetical protein E4U17_005499 [Claviceps sp. LM77 group G4]|nr:hypothetical protein E4U17_005499 [Claviceps sp. LM77 group G4]
MKTRSCNAKERIDYTDQDLRATVLIMVKILPFFLTTLAAISPVAQAAAAKPATCTPGLDYCGWLLIKSKGRGKEAYHETKTE